MSWHDWYMLETAVSTEKIIFNWVFMIGAVLFSKWLAGWMVKNGWIKE